MVRIVQFLIPLVLSLIAYAGLQPSLSVLESQNCPKYTQGYVKDEQVYICPNELTLPRQEVINHEVVHLVQSNLGVDTLLPGQVVNFLALHTLEEKDQLSVILYYSDSGYVSSEYEARILQKLHPRIIMSLLRFSQDYANLTNS